MLGSTDKFAVAASFEDLRLDWSRTSASVLASMSQRSPFSRWVDFGLANGAFGVLVPFLLKFLAKVDSPELSGGRVGDIVVAEMLVRRYVGVYPVIQVQKQCRCSGREVSRSLGVSED